MHVADVIHRAVVIEIIAAPITALIASAAIAVTIVHAAIEADIPAPIAMAESISAAKKSPIGRRP